MPMWALGFLLGLTVVIIFGVCVGVAVTQQHAKAMAERAWRSEAYLRELAGRQPGWLGTPGAPAIVQQYPELLERQPANPSLTNSVASQAPAIHIHLPAGLPPGWQPPAIGGGQR